MNHTEGNPSIHQKLCDIQNELLDCNIKKSGFNKYQKYPYYELKDLLPPILRLCKKYGCNIYFIFIDEYGILKFYSNDGKQEINTRIPIPNLVPINKGSNLIQSAGAYQTYAKKYLLMNLFGICEVDEIDMGYSSENSVKDSPQTDIEKTLNNIPSEKPILDEPAGLEKVREYLRNKDPDATFTKGTLNKARLDLFKKGVISKDENKKVYDYIMTLD